MRVEVLGPVQVRTGDEVVAIPRRTERALLAVLALRAGNVIGVETLTEALWGEDPPPTATRSLRSHLSRLRAHLGSDIARPESGGYLLDLPEESTDVGALRILVQDAGTARANGDLGAARGLLAEAEALWRGQPLTDLAEGPARTTELEWLRALWRQAQEGRLSLDLELGDPDRVCDEARAIVAEDPLREGAWRLLILALYRSGRQVDALHAYRDLVTLLADELGADPSPELQRLHWQVLRQDPQLDPSPPPPPLVAPAAVTSFVGRAGQVEAVAQGVAEQRLLTLHGPAGIGKSRLALEVARHVRAHFPDGVWWVDLTVATGLPSALSRLAGTLGVPTPPGLRAEDTLAAYLKHRELLLVLDNCEHIAGPLAPVVLGLLQAAPGLRVLATSRSYLEVTGESRWEVPPLEVPAAGADEQSIAAADSVVLFQQRRGRRVDQPALNTLADVAALCRRLDGIPLALELAAAHTHNRSVRELIDRPRADLLETSLAATSSAHHQSVQRAIEWSYSALDDSTQHLYDRLAVFPGDFDGSASRAIARDIAGLPEDQVLDRLSGLVDASLVAARPGGTTTRYRLLFVMREFAAARLSERGDAEAARRAFADHYRRLALAAVPVPGSNPTGVRLEELTSEWTNLGAAFTWTLDHGSPDDALAFIGAMGHLLWGASSDLVGTVWRARDVIAGAVDAPADLRAWAWLALVSAAYLAGDPALAVAACDRSEALFEDADDPAGVAATHLGRGVALFLALGELPAAEKHLEEGERVAHASGAARTEAWCQTYLVQLQCYAGPPSARTRQALVQAQRHVAATGDEMMRLQLTAGEALVHYGEHEYDACIATALRLDALSRRAGQQSVYGQLALVLRGAALLGKDEPEAARGLLLRGAQTELDSGWPIQLEVFLQVLAQLADREDPVRAARLWGAGTAHIPVWPGMASQWFPFRSRGALGERFDHEVEFGRTLSPAAAMDLATG
jgi:predicted ATPase